MTLEEKINYLIDRKEIEDKCILYAHAVDSKDFDLFRTLFTEDAVIDYTASGPRGIRGGVDEIIPFLDRSFRKVKSLHLMANIMVEFSENNLTAKTRVMLHNPLIIGLSKFYCGLWYNDVWIKTAQDGWKMKERVQEAGYTTVPKISNMVIRIQNLFKRKRNKK